MVLKGGSYVIWLFMPVLATKIGVVRVAVAIAVLEPCEGWSQKSAVLRCLSRVFCWRTIFQSAGAHVKA